MDYSTRNNKAVGAVVFRDSKDRIHHIFSTEFNVTEPTLAEARTMVEAANFAKKHNIRNVCFYSDNRDVVINMQEERGEETHFLLDDVSSEFRSLLRDFEDWKLSRISRNLNFLAHNVAKWARLNLADGAIDPGILPSAIFSDEDEWIP